MAWIVPMTAIAGQVVAAADFNQYLRDNLNLTEAALALNVSGFFVSTGSHAVAERIFTTNTVDVAENWSSGGVYGNLATFGPSVTVTSGAQAVVIIGARIGGAATTASNKMSWDCSGATTIAASDTWAAGAVGVGASGFLYSSRWYLATGLNAGSNTFTCKYANSSGTTSFDHRSIHVLPM